MDIQSLLEGVQQTSASGKALTGQPALRAGDILIAAVQEVEKGGDALLSFGQFKAYARLPLPVVAGQEVRIRVEAAHEGLRLFMVPGAAGQAIAGSGERLPIGLFEPVGDKPYASFPSRFLVPGQSLQGRITGIEKDGLQLVDFGKFKAFAKIDIPVRQGQVIPLKVIETDHGIALAVTARPRSAVPAQAPAAATDSEAPVASSGVQGTALPEAAHPSQRNTIQPAKGDSAGQPPSPPTTAEMATLREAVQALFDETKAPWKAVSLPDPVKTALANLERILNPASPGGDAATLAARIGDFVENSGLYFEKRLEQTINRLNDGPTPMPAGELSAQPPVHNLMVKDLKPNLLILKQFIDDQSFGGQKTDRHLPEALKSVVNRAVSHIAQQHLTATHKPADPVLLQVFSHPLLLAAPQRNARLKVYYSKKGRDDARKPPRVSLLLEMDRMGSVRSDLWMVGKDLNITFFVGEGAVKTAIDNAQGQIKTMLEDTFNTVAVSVVVNEKKIAAFDGEDLTIADHRLVDLSV